MKTPRAIPVLMGVGRIFSKGGH